MATRNLFQKFPKIFKKRKLGVLKTTLIAGGLLKFKFDLDKKIQKVKFKENTLNITFIPKEYFVKDIIDNDEENIFLIVFNKRQMFKKQTEDFKRNLFKFAKEMKEEVKLQIREGEKFKIHIIDRDDMEVVKKTWESMVKNKEMDFFDFSVQKKNTLVYFKKKGSKIFFDVNEKKVSKIAEIGEKRRYFKYFRKRIEGLLNPVEFISKDDDLRNFLLRYSGVKNTPLLLIRAEKNEEEEIKRLEEFLLKRRKLKVIKDDVKACVIKTDEEGEWSKILKPGSVNVIKNDFNDIYNFLHKGKKNEEFDTSAEKAAENHYNLTKDFLRERAFTISDKTFEGMEIEEVIELSKSLDFLVEPRTSIYSELNGEQVRQLFTDFMKAKEKGQYCLSIDLNKMDFSSKKILEIIGENLEEIENKVQPQIILNSGMKFYLTHLSPYHPQLSLYSYQELTKFQRYRKYFFDDFDLEKTKKISSDDFLEELQHNINEFGKLKGDEKDDRVSGYLQSDEIHNVTGNNFEYFMDQFEEKNRLILLGPDKSKSLFFYTKNFLKKFWDQKDYVIGNMYLPNTPSNFKIDVEADSPRLVVKLKDDDNYVVYDLPELDITDFENIKDERSEYLEKILNKIFFQNFN